MLPRSVFLWLPLGNSEKLLGNSFLCKKRNHFSRGGGTKNNLVLRWGPGKVHRMLFCLFLWPLTHSERDMREELCRAKVLGVCVFSRKRPRGLRSRCDSERPAEGSTVTARCAWPPQSSVNVKESQCIELSDLRGWLVAWFFLLVGYGHPINFNKLPRMSQCKQVKLLTFITTLT